MAGHIDITDDCHPCPRTKVSPISPTARPPVFWSSSVVRHSQYLDDGAALAIDDREREALQSNLANVWRPRHFVSMRRIHGLADGLQHRGVIPATEASTALLVVGDLSFVLQCRFWMEPVAHFK